MCAFRSASPRSGGATAVCGRGPIDVQLPNYTVRSCSLVNLLSESRCYPIAVHNNKVDPIAAARERHESAPTAGHLISWAGRVPRLLTLFYVRSRIRALTLHVRIFYHRRRVVWRLMVKFGSGYKRFWRPLIGIVAAYAVAAQSLLIALGGLNLAAQAQAKELQPGFELCLHAGQSAADLPIGNPGSPGCAHCIFCFAGSHHAVVGASPFVFVRLDAGIIDAPWIADKHVCGLSAYSIASPRGPPLRA